MLENLINNKCHEEKNYCKKIIHDTNEKIFIARTTKKKDMFVDARHHEKKKKYKV